MAEQVLIQFRVDKDLKQDVAAICAALGTDMPTVFRMCMKQMKIVRGIPFPTTLPNDIITAEEALNAFRSMRKAAADVPEMTLNEINEEIKAMRTEKERRKAEEE